jgi:uncharacterized membrane protein YebE (DUF533 family)
MPPIRRRRGRPVARAAVVGGGGAVAGKKYGEKKAKQEAEQAAPQGGARAEPGAEKDTLEQLKKLGELRDSGVLTEEEFEAQKKQLLGS